MILIGIPSKKHDLEEIGFAKTILSALKPDAIITDGVSPWARTLAYASFDFNARLYIVQPWRRIVDPAILKKASSVSIFNDSPSKFFLDNSRYFAWIRNNCTHASLLKDRDSSITHLYRVNLDGVKIYEHER